MRGSIKIEERERERERERIIFHLIFFFYLIGFLFIVKGKGNE